MKKSVFLLVLMFVIVLFALTACGGSKDDNNNNNNSTIPTDPYHPQVGATDWVLAFMPMQVGKEMENTILLMYVKDTNYPQPTDVVELTIDNQPVAMEAMPMLPNAFFGSKSLNPGSTYNILFKFNGQTKVSTTLKMVHPANAIFPPAYNPAQEAVINWTLPADNQYQFAGISSSNNDVNNPLSDDDVRQIGASLRTYTVPANAVENYGQDTNYNLQVEQVNYKLESRVALMSMDVKESSSTKAAMDVFEMANNAMQTIRQLQK